MDGWCWYAVCKAKVPRVHFNFMLIKKSKIYAWKAVGALEGDKYKNNVLILCKY